MPRIGVRIAVLVAVAAAVGLSALSRGIEYHVPDEYRTLREALQAAGTGDTIVLSTRRAIRESVTVRNKRQITIRAEDTFRRSATVEGRYDDEPVFELINCRDITFERINITAREGDDGVRSSAVGITTDNCTDIVLRECAISAHGGPGVKGGAITLEECTVSGNLTWGIELTEGAGMTLISTAVEGNANGGLYIRNATASLEQSSFTSNLGYGIVVDGSSSVRFSELGGPSSITGNSRGGILVKNATFTLQGNADVRNNQGVGIEAEDAQLTVSGAEISGHAGAGVLYRRSTGTVSSSSIVDNTGVGLLVDESSHVSLDGTTVARQGGDGVQVLNGSTLEMSGRALVTENRGAGVLADGTVIEVDESTIVSNGASGVRLIHEAAATIADSLVAENLAHGVAVLASSVTMRGGECRGNAGHGPVSYTHLRAHET